MPLRLKVQIGGSYRLLSRAVALLILLSLVTGCGGATPEADSQRSPLADAQTSPLAPTPTLAPTVTLPPTLVPTATVPPTPAATATLPPVPIQLTILHTNDNWGETEPCG